MVTPVFLYSDKAKTLMPPSQMPKNKNFNALSQMPKSKNLNAPEPNA